VLLRLLTARQLNSRAGPNCDHGRLSMCPQGAEWVRLASGSPGSGRRPRWGGRSLVMMTGAAGQGTGNSGLGETAEPGGAIRRLGRFVRLILWIGMDDLGHSLTRE
jgi:hypothetical protein